MDCPSCGEPQPEGAVSCRRCGAALGASGLVTGRVDVHPDDSTRPVELDRDLGSVEGRRGRPEADRDGDRDRHGHGEAGPARRRRALPFEEILAALRARGFITASGEAAAAFAAVLCVGTVLVVAARLEHPGLGGGAGPISVLTWIVIVSLGSLGAPIDLGGIDVGVLPLGALALAGWLIARVVRASHERRPIDAPGERASEGAKIGLPFGLLCLTAALLFRFPAGDATIGAQPGWALALGTLWGATFGALGASWADHRLRDLIAAGGRRVRALGGWASDALACAGAMLAAAFAAAGIASLAWLVIALARGAPRGPFGWGDALAGIVYLGAFLPNLLVDLIALGLGAVVDVGARVTVEGRAFGKIGALSLVDWNGSPTPGPAFLLLAIPFAAALAGAAATQRIPEPAARRRAVLLGALAFAGILGLGAGVADARLGAGLVETRGYALVAPRAALTFVLAGAWTAGLGLLGVALMEGRGSAAASGGGREGIRPGPPVVPPAARPADGTPRGSPRDPGREA